MRAAIPLLAALLSAPAAPALAQAPSFDCRTARSDAEKAICKSPQLARLDVEIAQAYAGARKAFAGDAPALAALREDQRDWLSVRDGAFDQSDNPVAGYFRERRDLLRRIVPRAPGEITGEWGSFLGLVAIARERGKLSASISTAEPVSARWLCDVEETLARDGDGWRMGDPADKDGDLGGFTLRFARAGALLQVTQAAPDGADFPVPPFCGHNGTVEGPYFPLRAK